MTLSKLKEMKSMLKLNRRQFGNQYPKHFSEVRFDQIKNKDKLRLKISREDEREK